MNAQTHQHKTRKLKRTIIIAAGGAVLLIVIYLIFAGSITRWYYKFKLRQLNVILITLDTVRSDYLSCYKKGNARTPHLDRIAQEGVLFERCIAQSPLTLPSHVTIFSGTYPLFHQVRDNGGFRVPGQLEFVSEVLQSGGFVTSAFIGAYVLHSKWGVNQGFDTFSDDFDLKKYYTTTREIEKKADEVLGNARTWLKTHGHKKKFFTWIHLFDPHIPYDPPPPYAEKYADNPYRGEVEFVDEQLGKFFAFLKKEGLENKTLIVITGDHGEGLWQHREHTHGVFIYETTVRVPLIIKAPFQFPVKQVKEIVEHVDIAPTLLHAAGSSIPHSYQGKSFLNMMFGKEEKGKQTAYTESFYSRLHRGWSQLQALYRDDWKYIRAPNDELYHIHNDPDEENNLSIKKSFIKKTMKERLGHFIKEKSINAITPQQLDKRDKADLKMLESLGYLTTFADTSGKTNLPDPKDKVHLLNDYAKASGLINIGKFNQAVILLRRIIADDPANVDAYLKLGVAYNKKKMYQEAVECFHEILKRKPDYNTAMINLLQSLTAMGKFDEAIREARQFLKLFPQDYSLLNELGTACFFKGEYPEALEYLKKSVEIEDVNSLAYLRLGEIYLKKKEYALAESFVKKALTIYPQLENACCVMGQIRDARGDFTQAAEYYKRELENHPHHLFAAFYLAEGLKKNDAYDRAIPYYRRAIEIDPGFKLPYFMIANYYLDRGERLQEAIDLCKTGTRLEPHDESTLYGFYLLTNLYAKLGSSAQVRFYTVQGEKLLKKLKQKKTTDER
ncbi:MAG: tetratricopeptide repeat protein [Candidatus Aminicenantes bacterium]|nr:MAG: tetratricopeptide repeat protein [Candidatus Aminicenantes bacterium]